MESLKERFEIALDTLLDELGLPRSYRVLGGKGTSRVNVHYRQLRSSECGLAACKTVLEAFGIKAGDERIKRGLKISSKYGTSTTAMICFLRRNGLRVGKIKNPRFGDLVDAISRDSIILTTVRRSSEVEHWVALFDVEVLERKVSVSGDNLFWTASEDWREFKRRMGRDNEFIVVRGK